VLPTERLEHLAELAILTKDFFSPQLLSGYRPGLRFLICAGKEHSATYHIAGATEKGGALAGLFDRTGSIADLRADFGHNRTCMGALRVKRFVQGILFFLVPSFLVQPEDPFLCPNP